MTMDTMHFVPPLSDLPSAAREALAERARKVRFDPDERLISLGQPPDRLLVLVEGLAKLVGISANGHERILYVFRPGEPVGANAILDSFDNDYETTAMSPVEAIAISRRDLLRVGRDHPELILVLAREVARLLEAMTARVVAATSAEVPVRLSGLLLEFADGDEPSELPGYVPLAHRLTHESMAQIVGASRPHTSTVLRELETLGAVRRRSRRGLLVRLDRLREIVDSGDLDEIRFRNDIPARNGNLRLGSVA